MQLINSRETLATRGGDLIAEFRIKPGDIGHVEIGDPADTFVAGYDPNIQGTLLPGMQVNAKIISGSKSIVRYMLKPITKTLENIFSER